VRALAGASLAALLLLAGCGGGLGGGGVITCTGTGTVIGGQVFYEDKLYNLGGFISPHVSRPVRFAAVEIRNQSGGALLASARTDTSGVYCISTTLAGAPPQVFVRVKADALPTGGRARVADYDGDVYYVDSGPAPLVQSDLNLLPTLNVREDTPWKQSQIGGSVSFAGGAFNILDVATGGIEFVKGRWARDLPNLTLVWQASLAEGSGTFYDPSQDTIHIKGNSSGDSDEYDDDIILHEFGHFTLKVLSKDTSKGGQHFINGNTQDARLAWSEGWANFFSGMVRDVNGAAFSNRSGQRGTLIDALFTAGPSRALRFAIEMVTPKAFLPDTQNPANETAVATAQIFDLRVKYVTSEVSVASALWDVYAGVPGAPGIGLDGILDVIETIRRDDPPITTFASFWEAFEARYPTQAAGLMGHIVDDRRITLEDDAWGADDTLAELNALTGLNRIRHEFLGLSPGANQGPSAGHTLTPVGDVGDVDLFHLQVSGNTTVQATTTDLHDGADTYLRLLAADGTTVLAENDNYLPLVLTVQWGTNGGLVQGSIQLTSYPADGTGQCGPYTIVSGNYSTTAYFCPPNAANPPLDGSTPGPEYLASRITADLAPGDYYVEVTRSPFAPPSAGAYGGYTLQVKGLP